MLIQLKTFREVETRKHSDGDRTSAGDHPAEGKVLTVGLGITGINRSVGKLPAYRGFIC